MARTIADPDTVQDGEQKTTSTTLHAHGDGTYHTTSDYGGKRVEHASIGHALLHMAKKHSAEDHVHIHAHDDGSYTSHHVEEGGKVQGPHDHKNLRELKRSLSTFLDEEGLEK